MKRISILAGLLIAVASMLIPSAAQASRTAAEPVRRLDHGSAAGYDARTTASRR